MEATSAVALKNRIADLPHRPGVYIYKNSAGKVIYIGKAIDLKKRVSSYFKPAGADWGKVEQLVAQIRDLDFIITHNEIEALILESTLIKKHRPRFNVMLKDDKGYPYIKLTSEEYPRLELARRVADDGAKYFGPYTSAASVRQSIHFLQRVFPLRMCRVMKGGGAAGPCMYYHIGKCAGPCSGKVSREEYDHNVGAVTLFLQGRLGEVISRLRESMDEAAAEKMFEKAAIYRDRLGSLESVYKHKQEVVLESKIDMDVVGINVEAGLACCEVMFVRQGMLIGHDPFILRTGVADTPSEVAEEFLMQYYANRHDIPPEVAVSHLPPNPALMKEYIAGKRGFSVKVTLPQRGSKASLTAMAAKNAAQRLKDELRKDLANAEQAGRLLSALAERIGAERPPQRIVGFDISTIQGTDTVGSAVAFSGGTPDKAGYRKFKIRGSGTDDFSSMQEMAARYLTRVIAGDWPAPDLIIVDGGKGQVSAVEHGIADARYDRPVMVMGFAKEHMVSYIIGRTRPVKFEPDEPAAHMVRRVISEAHRFAITFHRKKRGERMLNE